MSESNCERESGSVTALKAKTATPRPTSQGDVPPRLSAKGILEFETKAGTDAALENEIATIKSLLDGKSLDDRRRLLEHLLERESVAAEPADRAVLDMELAPGWRDGAYPHKNLMSRKTYEKQKFLLQTELLKLQARVRYVLHKFPYANKSQDTIGRVDPLLVGRAHVVYAEVLSAETQAFATESCG